MWHRVAVGVLFLSFFRANCAQSLAPSAAARAFTDHFGSAPASGPSFGDIDGDGVDDFVAFLSEPAGHALNERVRATLFLGTGTGNFRFFAMTRDVFVHDRADNSHMIEKSSIFIHRSGSGGCCSRWSERFQFRMQNQQLWLIGIETASYGTTGPPSDAGTSVNLLSKQILYWEVRGSRRTERRVKVPELKTIEFSNFSYEDLPNQLPAGILR